MTPGFDTLCTLLVQTGLDAVVGDPNTSLTVFAPSNAAFDAIADALPTLTDEEVEFILLYHAVNGALFADQIPCDGFITMVNGLATQTFCQFDGIFQIGIGNTAANAPRLIAVDIEACNGVIHVVNNVILPFALPLPPNPMVAEVQSSSFTLRYDLPEGSQAAQRSDIIPNPNDQALQSVTDNYLLNFFNASDVTLFIDFLVQDTRQGQGIVDADVIFIEWFVKGTFNKSQIPDTAALDALIQTAFDPINLVEGYLFLVHTNLSSTNVFSTTEMIVLEPGFPMSSVRQIAP